MSKELTTVNPYTYVVYTDSTCTIMDSATGRILQTAVAGEPNYFTAIGDAVILTDDAATMRHPVFKEAPVVIKRRDGGSTLPPQYLPLEFLGATGSQYIATDYEPQLGCEIWADVQLQGRTDAIYTSIAAGNSVPNRLGVVSRGGLTYAVYFGEAKSVSTSYERRLYHIDSEGRLTVGATSIQLPITGTEANTPLYLCANVDKTSYWTGYIFSVKIKDSASIYLLPALDPFGVPCMYDLFTGKTYYNSGTGAQFEAGLTQAQAEKLGSKLPATGGQLTVWLPTGYDSTEEWTNSKILAEGKGWEVTVKTYTPANTAATYSMRRCRQLVWCRPQLSENGEYVAANGARVNIEWCVEIIGSRPEARGYEPFDSIDAAAEHWQLVPYEAPEEETLNQN